MKDLEKEEFLQRLDIRIGAMLGMMAYHEKYIASTLYNSQQMKNVEKRIDEASQKFFDYIVNSDKEIKENFERIKKEVEVKGK